MRALGFFGCGMAALFGTAAAAAPGLGDPDRAAIAALERSVVALPGPRPGPRLAPLAERMRDMNVPAVSVAFIEDGRVKWARAYGEAVAGSGRTVTPATLFQAGSLSKAVAAAGALRLVDQGKLALDEDVNLRLRAWRVPASAQWAGIITLRRLLGHTAGLTLSAYPGYRAGEPVPTLVQSLAGAKPARTAPVRRFLFPGTQTAYSGGGYSVAQLLMTETAGADFPRLMQRLVLRPAGMTRSTFGASGDDAAGGHDPEGVPIAGGGNVYPELAAAGLWTTPSDYGRFLIALQDARAAGRGALLKPATAQAMTTPIFSNYGLGVTVMARRGRPLVTHAGANQGFECRFVAFLDGSRQGLVIMTNGDNGGFLAAAIQRTLTTAYGLDDALGPPPPRAPES
ncbi:MAG TPA: serine hydrolase domain-containing protein [Allosphingosinicella sp.]|nr:serine hydrolase domain-containing protein [Allosphingosinicella sp.]